MIQFLVVLCVVCFTVSIICLIFGYVWFFFNYLPSLYKDEESACVTSLNTKEDWDEGDEGIDCYEDYVREYGGYGYD